MFQIPQHFQVFQTSGHPENLPQPEQALFNITNACTKGAT